METDNGAEIMERHEKWYDNFMQKHLYDTAAGTIVGVGSLSMIGNMAKGGVNKWNVAGEAAMLTLGLIWAAARKRGIIGDSKPHG
jgi:hypothetical protein